MIKAVLFDLDGTLLDTLPDIKAVLNQMLRSYNYPEVSTEQVREYIGEGAFRLMERALPAGTKNVDECFARFVEMYAASANALTRPFDGVTELLKRLKARGLKLGMVTNKPQLATEACVKQFFPDVFDVVIGDGGLFPVKPDPSGARYAALSLHVAPSECAFVGDGETDVLTAIRAEMFGIAVLWGYRSREQLSAVGATRFAESVLELENFL